MSIIPSVDDRHGFAPAPWPVSRRSLLAIVIVTTAALWVALAWVSGPPIEKCLLTLCLPSGLLCLDLAHSNWSTSRRLRGASCVPIRETSGGVVAIRGRVLPSELGLLISPASGRSAVWARLKVKGDDPEGGAAGVTIKTFIAARDFLIDDGSGELAYVVANQARFEPHLFHTRWATPADPEMRAVLEARGIDRLVGIDGRRRDVGEDILEPGDEVIAIGPSRRERPSEHDRHAASVPRLILEGRGRGARSLLVAAWPPSTSDPTLWFPVVVGVMLVALGVAPIVFRL
jgi:hypothetical protein